MSVAFDEYDLIRSITKKSFYDFVVEFWDEIVPDPFIPNWHIKYVCDQVQEEVELILARKPKRYDYIIINVPPGSSKSTILMIMLNAWVWARDPSRGFIGASFERELAVDHARKARDLIKSEKYQRCFGFDKDGNPWVQIKRDMDAKGTFGTTRKGTRYSTGTTGNVTGKHADVIVVDDPLNPRAARSEALMKEVNRFMTETLPSRKRQKNLVPTFLIMQRLAEDDPTGMLLDLAKREPDKIKIKHICLPWKESSLINPPEAKKYYKDGLLDPVRLGPEQVEKDRVTLGEFAFAGQYEQSPIPAGGSMFRVEMLKTGIAPPDPNNPKLWVKQVRYTDKAATYDAGCYTASVRMGKDLDQRFWVIHVERYRQESAVREARIKKVAEIDGLHVVQALEQEGGSAGKADAQATARNLAGHRVVLDHPTGDKALRAEPFATQVNSGNVYLAPEGCISGLSNEWHTAYIGELQFFPFSKFKDQVDASSGAFNQLVTGVFRVGFLKGAGRMGRGLRRLR